MSASDDIRAAAQAQAPLRAADGEVPAQPPEPDESVPEWEPPRITSRELPAGDPALARLGQVSESTRRKVSDVVEATEAATGVHLQVCWGKGGEPEHSTGRAVDFMVTALDGSWLPNHVAVGDHIAGLVIQQRQQWHLGWVIWRQRIWNADKDGFRGDGSPAWRAMADRGSRTQNHLDHPHVYWRSDRYTPLPGGGGGGGQPIAGGGPGQPDRIVTQSYHGDVRLDQLRFGVSGSDSVRRLQQALRDYPGIETIPLNPSGVTGGFFTETEAMVRLVYETFRAWDPTGGWEAGDPRSPGPGLCRVLGLRVVR